MKHTGFLLLLITCLASCRRGALNQPLSDYRRDSLQVEALLGMGDSLYAVRSGFGTIAESMIYFDSAYRVARRMQDTLLQANALYYIGNVYNAWNQEPRTTLAYYQRAYALFLKLPGRQADAYQLRYIIAHALDGEKLGDSLRCVQTIQAAVQDLQRLPDSARDQMNFLPDFAWVAANSKAYDLAEKVLQTLAPRHRIANDPRSNNYLDHYYLTRSRIDVYRYGRRATPYLDSLVLALQGCNNRFDSAYYSHNLSVLYEAIGRPSQALHFARLSQALSQQTGQNDVLSALRQALLDREVQAARERERRIRSENSRRNTLLIGSGLLLLLLFLLWQLGQRRKKDAAERRQQQDFTRLLLQKAEDERRRIATDLHDGVNHDLLAMKNNLLLHQPVGTEDVEGVITAVREISRDLYPALFESVGLSASVEALCERFTKAGFFTTCDIRYGQALDKEQELQVYRIVQEALNNIAKHAAAEAARIVIRDDIGSFFLEIKDNGKGFDAARLLNCRESFGLQSIQQRAAAIGAALSVSSSAAGTVLQLSKTPLK